MAAKGSGETVIVLMCALTSRKALLFLPPPPPYLLLYVVRDLLPIADAELARYHTLVGDPSSLTDG